MQTLLTGQFMDGLLAFGDFQRRLKVVPGTILLSLLVIAITLYMPVTFCFLHFSIWSTALVPMLHYGCNKFRSYLSGVLSEAGFLPFPQ
jgi:hypothetical protein